MILDTSAVLALFLKEPGFQEILEKLSRRGEVGIGVPTLIETCIVLSARLKRDARGMLARFVEEASVDVIPFGEVHYAHAVDAWLQFGKGRHPAALNFADCLAYAVAKTTGQPLLCVGNDFRQTDLDIA